MTSLLLQLPYDVRAEILFHCMVTNQPITFAYTAKLCYMGGLFLLEDPEYFSLWWTCRQLGMEGTRIFFMHNTFVFGDFLEDYGFFKASRRWVPFFDWRDGRICNHQRSMICPHALWQ